MEKKYLDMNVREATEERLHFIFREFENVFVSFSGGKDSGLLLELVIDFRDKYYPGRRVGVFHQDFETQYEKTTAYVERTFTRLEGKADLYWVCLPMATRTAVSNYEMYWYPWDDTCPEKWVRPMPKRDYVINLENNPMTTYSYRMHQEDLARQFCRWYKLRSGGGKTVCLLGLRAAESLRRYNGFLNKKYGYGEQCWISKQFKEVWTASPLYDWSVSDVWHAIYENGYDYNKIYDLYYQAGCSPDEMRVASPFNDYAKDSLNLYRVIEPKTWAKLVGRVQGANFGSIYGSTKAMGAKELTLPEGHTWRSYTRFLLTTLPREVRESYIKKFRTSIEFWHKTGGGLEKETIRELIEHGYNIRRNGISNYTIRRLTRIVFVGDIPDHTDDILSTKDVPSWKRMCYCILKNDHNCRYMGFGLTREQQRRIDKLKTQYKKVTEEV